MTINLRSFCQYGFTAIVFLFSFSCMEKKSSGVPIKFSGAALAEETGDGIAIEILSSEVQATRAGLSAELSRTIFAASILECANSSDHFYFYCKSDPNCTKSCVIHSAKKDGTDERIEEKDSDGKVLYLPGRIYWCPCE